MAVLGQYVVGLIFVSAVIYLTVTLAHAAILPTTGNAQDEIVGKRAAFHAWAGKRSVSSNSRLRAETVPQPFISHRPIAHDHGTLSSKHTGDDNRKSVLEETPDHSSLGNAWRRTHLGDNAEPQRTGVETGHNQQDKELEQDKEEEQNKEIEQGKEVEQEDKTMNVATLNDTDVGDILKRAAFGKRASFSSWAGKRGNLANVYDTRGDTSPTHQVWLHRRSNGYDVYPAQVPVSWAGRRAQHPHHAKTVMLVNTELSAGRTGSAGTVKRVTFRPLAGNREFQPSLTRNSAQKQQKIKELVTRKALNAWASKRAPFSVWAGKRSDEVNTGHWLDKPRQDDYSLERDDYSLTQGMSRQDEETAVQNRDRSGQDENRSGQYKGRSIQDGARKRAAFSAWAGKRSKLSLSPENSKTAFAARPDKFSDPSWQSSKGDMSALLHSANKRSRLSDQQLGGLHESKERRTMEAPRRSYHLLHKRAVSNAKGGKRAAVNSRDTWPWNHSRWSGKRAPFNAWGGKRSTTFLSPQDDVKAEELFHVVGLTRRAPFSAWGGKRSFPAEIPRPEPRAGSHAWAGKRGEPQDSYTVPIYGDHGGPENGYSNPTSGDKESPEDGYFNPTSGDKESPEDDYSAPTSDDHGGAEEVYKKPTAYNQGGADRDLHDISIQDKQRTLPIASPFLNNKVAEDALSDHAFSSPSGQIFPVPFHPYRNLAKGSPQDVQVRTPHLVFISSSSRNGPIHIGLGSSTFAGFRKDISELPAEVQGYSQHEDARELNIHNVRSWPLITYLALMPDSGPVKRRFNSWAGRR